MTENNRRKHVSRGMSLPSVLLLIFIILKLTGNITWSWLWVLSPLWIAVGLGLLFFIIIGLILLMAVIGIADESSRVITSIKSWFHRENWDH